MTLKAKGMKIDFGGIAKGYTSEAVINAYKKAGVTSGLVNLGGNVQTLEKNLVEKIGRLQFKIQEKENHF